MDTIRESLTISDAFGALRTLTCVSLLLILEVIDFLGPLTFLDSSRWVWLEKYSNSSMRMNALALGPWGGRGSWVRVVVGFCSVGLCVVPLRSSPLGPLVAHSLRGGGIRPALRLHRLEPNTNHERDKKD